MSYPVEPHSTNTFPETLHSVQFNSARERESSEDGTASPGGASKPLVTQVDIVCKRHSCVLTLSEERQTVRITRVTPAGKQKTLLHVPLYVVLNVESGAERDARQALRKTNDETSKEEFVLRDSNALQAACMGNCNPSSAASYDDHDTPLYTHTRVDTGVSMSTNASPSTSATSFHNPRITDQGVYYIHYVRVASRLKKSIHTVAFSAAAGSAEDTAIVVRRLVDAIYKGGVRQLHFFISPKSGSGQGEKIFEKEVKPLLHFTRHTITTSVTQRAHECEDYCADLHNDLTANHVVVGVGGDGMVNEIVNGLHRRKLALIAHFRSLADASSSMSGSSTQPMATATTEEYPTEDFSKKAATPTAAQKHFLRQLRVPTHFNVAKLLHDGWSGTLPLVATLATGSACGLAKSLGVLSSAEAALALVHLNTVDMDLMRMSFTANEDLIRHHEERLSARKRQKVQRKFESFQDAYSEEMQPRASTPHGAMPSSGSVHVNPQRDSSTGRVLSPTGTRTSDAPVDPDVTASPFRADGSGRFSTAVAHHLGAPDMRERVAFMSLSFGMANDIDRGSEHLRWMGNARFTVYGGYCLLRGVRKYQTTLRYLPWQSAITGKGLEKLHTSDTMPSTTELPVCTMRTTCPHCRGNQPSWEEARLAKLRAGLAQAISSPDHTHDRLVDLLEMDGEDVTEAEVARTLQCLSQSELLAEDAVDFDGTEEDGWVTITGSFYNILLCNLRDVAQDMNMAPRCHMSDGAIDIVFSRIMPGLEKGGGRREFIQMMGALEKGEHVDYGFVNYVKARAVEIKVDDGISMSDGEMMPLSSVHLTKMRNGVRFVRSD